MSQSEASSEFNRNFRSPKTSLIRQEEKTTQYEGKRAGLLHSSYTQLWVFCLVNLGTMGMWNALNTMGGLGTGDPDVAWVANIAVALCQTLGSFFAGSVINLIGLRIAMPISSFSFATVLLIVHFYYFYTSYSLAVAGVIICLCGIVNSVLMAGTGICLVSYPTVEERPVYITYFSIILNLGGIGGAILALLMNLNTVETEEELGMTKSSHLTLCMIAVAAIAVALLVVDRSKVIRSDGSAVEAVVASFSSELKGLREGIKDKNMWYMSVFCGCQMWHEVFLYNWINLDAFNTRGRSFNAAMYYCGRVIFAILFKIVVSIPQTVPRQAYAGAFLTLTVFLCTFVLVSLKAFDVAGLGSASGLDWTQAKSGLFSLAFLLFGGMETLCYNHANWMVGSLPTNDPAVVSRYGGWIRMFAAVGLGIAWLVGTKGTIPYVYQWMCYCVVYVVGLSLLLKLIHSTFSSSTRKEEDRSSVICNLEAITSLESFSV